MQSSVDNSVSAISWHYTRVLWCGSPCQLAENERELWTVRSGACSNSSNNNNNNNNYNVHNNNNNFVKRPPARPPLRVVVIVAVVIALCCCCCCLLLLLLLLVIVACCCCSLLLLLLLLSTRAQPSETFEMRSARAAQSPSTSTAQLALCCPGDMASQAWK